MLVSTSIVDVQSAGVCVCGTSFFNVADSGLSQLQKVNIINTSQISHIYKRRLSVTEDLHKADVTRMSSRKSNRF